MSIKGFGDVAEKLRRSTVLVRAGGPGTGSGVIWSDAGRVITNAHVARGAQIHLELWDGREFPAQIASRDPVRDLAELRFDATGLPSVVAADSSRVRPGELAIAVGNPLGFVGALTTGMIHAVGPLRGLGERHWVQADIRLAPGNSGGPLADVKGRVIGINTMIAGGLALAIPSNAVSEFLASGPSDAFLGVTLRPVWLPASKAAGPNAQRFGLLLLEVEPGSPAATASLLAGDILIGTQEKSLTSVAELSRLLQGKGERVVRLEFLRGDYARVRRVSVLLGVPALSRSPIAA